MAGLILVTGASGFTGRWFIAAAISQGYRCIGVSQSANTVLPGNTPNKVCDLTDFAAVQAVIQEVKPDYVVHLAAISFVAHGSTRDMYLTNVVATTNLLDAAIKHCPNIKKVLIASSGNVYGNTTSLPITEQTPFAPANDYAVSKVAMEYAVSLRMAQLPIVVTRPFNYTGVGQAEHFLLPKIVAAFRHKQTSLELGNLDVARDFSDVRDIVRAYLKLLAAEVSSDVFNLCSGQAVTLRQVITQVEQLAGYAITISVNPAFVRANEVKELYGTEQKLLRVIGTYRQHTSLRDTLAWMLQQG